MRLGAPIYEKTTEPQAWAAAVRRAGYSAAYCPVGPDANDATVAAYAQAASAADIVIAEVGAWSNPIARDATLRQEALTLCQRRLDLAERIGARCCVNIAGACGSKWDGPHPDNLTAETFDLIVQTVRGIIDAVKPKRTFYTLETMPWVYPDSADSYLQLIRAIDRKSFAVHLDPANLINCPARYFRNGDLIRECFAKLGPHIRSCHGKDVVLHEKMTVHLDECRPGLGGMDYQAFLTELNKLEPDLALMLEHLPSAEEYAAAAEYVRTEAKEAGVSFR